MNSGRNQSLKLEVNEKFPYAAVIRVLCFRSLMSVMDVEFFYVRRGKLAE